MTQPISAPPAQHVDPLRTPEALDAQRSARLGRRRARVIFIVRGMAHGFTDKQLGEMLGMTKSAFTNMLYREMRRTSSMNRVQLTFYFIKHGIITGDDIRKVPTHGEGAQL